MNFDNAKSQVFEWMGKRYKVVADESVSDDIFSGFNVDSGGFVTRTSEYAEAWESGLIKNAILDEIEARGRRDGLDRDRDLAAVEDSWTDDVIEF